MNTNAVTSITSAIDRHAGGQPSRGFESHDLVSLSRRILAPIEVTEQLLAEGVLTSTGPVHANDHTGLHTFNSEQLTKTRTAVLVAIAEKTIECSDGAPEQVGFAAGEALRLHVATFEKKTKGTTELSRFPEGLVQLATYRTEEEVPTAQQRAGRIAAVGGLAYGATSLFRGRKLRPRTGPLNQVKAGSAANIATGRTVAGALGAGASKAAAAVRGRFR